MTVAELIAQLREMPQEARVMTMDLESGDYVEFERTLLIDKEAGGCEHCNADLPIVVMSLL